MAKWRGARKPKSLTRAPLAAEPGGRGEPRDPGSASRSKVARLGLGAKEAVLLLPRLVRLFYRLFRDPEVPFESKVICGACLTYIVLPMDIIPDFIPVIGQLDDLYVASLGLSYLLKSAGEKKLREHWTGHGDIVGVLGSMNELVWRILPGPILNGVTEAFDRLRARRPRDGAGGEDLGGGGPSITLDPEEFRVME